MTTLAATLEDYWNDDEPQSPFEISALSTMKGELPDSDASEYELEEEVSLFAEVQAQDHMFQTLKESLESVVHEALAKYSVTQTKESKNSEPNHVSEISEFWNDWSMDIEIDEEINSGEEIYIQEEIAIQAHKSVLKHDSKSQLILPSPSPISCPLITTTSNIKQETLVSTRLPSSLPYLEVSFVSSPSLPGSSPTSLEIISLEKSSKTKKRQNKQGKPNITKTKKRKSNSSPSTTILTIPIGTSSPDQETNYIAPKKVYSKQNLRKKIQSS